jgi:hypothetical protein
LEELLPLQGRRISQASGKLFVGFLPHGILYDPENGGDTFLRNISGLPIFVLFIVAAVKTLNAILPFLFS